MPGQGSCWPWLLGHCLGSLCRRAKLLLKKKRYREQLLDKTENQITSLETMVGLVGVGGCGPWTM